MICGEVSVFLLPTEFPLLGKNNRILLVLNWYWWRTQLNIHSPDWPYDFGLLLHFLAKELKMLMCKGPLFFFKKREGWGIRLAPCQIWTQGQSQVGMAYAQSAACRALSSSLGSAKPSCTQLSLLPTQHVPSCQINECSENGHLFAVWCNPFSFSTHPKLLLTSRRK